MMQVKPIQPSDFDLLYEAFLKDDDTRLSRTEWQRMFQAGSCSGSDSKAENLGYMLVDNDCIGGMLGTIESTRWIGDQVVRFCNLHSWFVKDSHRGYSLLLMRQVLKDKQRVVTDFTATPPVVAISSRLGFRTFHVRQRLFYGVPARDSRGGRSGILCRWNDAIDDRDLNPESRQIFQDHQDDEFQHLSLQTSAGNAYLLMRRVDFHWRPYANLLYISNPNPLSVSQYYWQTAIMNQMKVRYLAGLDHFFPARLARTLLIRNPQPWLIRADASLKFSVDSLYSEVSRLGLTLLPGLRSVVQGFLRRLSLRRNPVPV